MGNKTKKILLVFIFIVLLLPVVEQTLPFTTSAVLYGYFDYAPETSFSFKKWFNGSYEKETSKYVNDFTGFRADLVRLDYQIDFSLFGKLYGGAFRGLHNCLFYATYMEAYKGIDFIGDSLIRQNLLKLKAVSDTLERLGKSLVFVHCPSKASFFAENLPEYYQKIQSGPTNKQWYVRLEDSLGIHSIDFEEWFLSMKNKSKDSLFSKQGIHWTCYGAFIAGDSLVRYIERLRRIQMLHPLCSGMIHTQKAQDPDADIGNVENLIFPVAKETYTYPVFTYPEDSTKKKPRVIFIGDSFVINMIKNWTLQGVTTDWQFWFYFKYVMNRDNPKSDPGNPKIENFNWKAELDKTDCVVMMYTSPGLFRLYYGDNFISQAYNYYYPKK